MGLLKYVKFLEQRFCQSADLLNFTYAPLRVCKIDDKAFNFLLGMLSHLIIRNGCYREKHRSQVWPECFSFLKRANRWSPKGAVSKRVLVTSAAPFLFALSADSKAANETNGIQNKRSHRKNWFTPSMVTLLGDFLFSGLRHLPAPAMEKHPSALAGFVLLHAIYRSEAKTLETFSQRHPPPTCS